MTASSISSLLVFPESQAHGDAEELVLLRQAQAGCDEAFRSLVERHQQQVHRFCFHHLRNDDDAREATQDTFIRAHAALPRYQPRTALSSWLFRIALNLCRDQARRAKCRVQPTTTDQRDAASPAPGPDDAAVHGADLEKLERGLAALPEKARSVLVMSCLDGLSHAECAEIMGCSERAIEGRLHRARRALASWWEKDGA